MKPNKTILFARTATPSAYGGAETYTLTTSKILSKNGFTPIIATNSPQLLDTAKDSHIQAIKTPWLKMQNWSGGRILLIPIYLIWLIYLTLWYVILITKLKADVLHLESKDDFIAGTIAGRILRKKIIWHDHMDLRYIFENVKKPLKNINGKLVYVCSLLADKIIIISDNELKIIKTKIPTNSSINNKIVRIDNGVIDVRSKYITHRAPLDSNKLIFCLASRIVENKGIGEAIEAFNIFSKKHPGNHTLDIYGTGQDYDIFVQQAKSNENIIFHGHKQDALICISKADVFMLPSYQEGLSMALLESTMLGKAIVVSNVDSNPEVIQDKSNGLLVAPRSAKDLAKAMEWYVNNPSKILLFEKESRRTYITKFNLETIIKNRLIPLYE